MSFSSWHDAFDKYNEYILGKVRNILADNKADSVLVLTKFTFCEEMEIIISDNNCDMEKIK